MKNFDLNACGVQEMNAAEVAEVNGGLKWEETCRMPDGYGESHSGSNNNSNFGLYVWFIAALNSAMN